MEGKDMAGDWIPMRLDLAEDPAVMQMADQLNCREELIVGYLHKIWSWASRQCKDGTVEGVTLGSLGRITHTGDFPAVMADAGWLEEHDNCVTFPAFEVWLGQSAKKRLDAAKRKALSRSHVTNVTTKSQTYVTKTCIPSQLRKTIVNRDCDTCQYCGWTKGSKSPVGPYINAKLSIDHVVPECLGGETSERNLVACCTVCNTVKGARTPKEAGFVLSKAVPKQVSEYVSNFVTNVTKYCDKSVTTGQDRTGENRTEENKKREKKTASPSHAFVKPSIQELKAFKAEHDLSFDAAGFLDYYDSNGWMVGKSKMKDWKAAARNWSRRDGVNGHTAPAKRDKNGRIVIFGGNND